MDRIETVLSCSSSVMIFRISFDPSWFSNIFEKCWTQDQIPNESATHSLTLKFLGLMIQSDGIFMREFCAKDGIKYLRSLLISQIDLADVIIVLGMFFRIPLHTLPKPSQLQDYTGTNRNSGKDDSSSRNKKDSDYRTIRKASTPERRRKGSASESQTNALTVLLQPEGCRGPDMTGSGLKEFTLPLFEIILECLGAPHADQTHTVEIDSGREGDKNSGGAVKNVILTSLSHAYHSLPPFRRLLQQQEAMQILITALISFSDVNAVPSGGGGNYPTGRADTDLPNTLRENHFSLVPVQSCITPDRADRNTANSIGVRAGNVLSLIPSDSAHYETENSFCSVASGSTSGSTSGSSSCGKAESGIFRASANWESLLSENPVPSNSSNSGVDVSQFSAPLIGASDAYPGVSFSEEGTTLLHLLSSLISSAITEFENTNVLCSLLLSVPEQPYSNKLQRSIMEIFKSVVEDIFGTCFDPSVSRKSRNILSILSGILNHLTPFVRSKVFPSAMYFQMLQLTIVVLLKSYDLYSNDLSYSVSSDKLSSELNDSYMKNKEKDKESDRDKEKRERNKICTLLIVKDLGKTARFLSSSCLQAVEEREIAGMKDRSEGYNCPFCHYIIYCDISMDFFSPLFPSNIPY